jgi:hypothetical protein
MSKLRNAAAVMFVGCLLALAVPGAASVAPKAAPRLSAPASHGPAGWLHRLILLVCGGDSGWGMDPNG